MVTDGQNLSMSQAPVPSCLSAPRVVKDLCYLSYLQVSVMPKLVMRTHTDSWLMFLYSEMLFQCKVLVSDSQVDSLQVYTMQIMGITQAYL